MGCATSPSAGIMLVPPPSAPGPRTGRGSPCRAHHGLGQRWQRGASLSTRAHSLLAPSCLPHKPHTPCPTASPKTPHGVPLSTQRCSEVTAPCIWAAHRLSRRAKRRFPPGSASPGRYLVARQGGPSSYLSPQQKNKGKPHRLADSPYRGAASFPPGTALPPHTEPHCPHRDNSRHPETFPGPAVLLGSYHSPASNPVWWGGGSRGLHPFRWR